MDCSFIKSLTVEQKTELRKLLDEDAKPKPIPITVYSERWNSVKMKFIQEHFEQATLPLVRESWNGRRIEWYENGRKKMEGTYRNGWCYGLFTEWDENGNKIAEYMTENNIVVNKE